MAKRTMENFKVGGGYMTVGAVLKAIGLGLWWLFKVAFIVGCLYFSSVYMYRWGYYTAYEEIGTLFTKEAV